MEFVIAGISFLIGSILGLLLSRLLFRPVVSTEEWQSLREEKAILESKCSVFELDRQKIESRLNEVQQAHLETEKVRAALDAQKSALEKQINEQRTTLKLEFENLSNKIFSEKTAQLHSESNKSLEAVLNPLKEKIDGFKKQVEDTYQRESREVFALKQEITRIVEVNQKMSAETVNLTKALRGDVKAQGNWGEIVLEKILEASGLRKEEEYIVQGKDMQLRTSDGRLQKPDVIINLPEEKHIIIDSKVSLTHYDQYIAAETEEEKEILAKQFLDSIYAHIKGLEAKKYHHLDKLLTPEFVLLFFPIEGAFSLAAQKDSQLFSFAWDRSIVIVSPTTLLATLRTVASVWKQERQNKNALRIAVESGRLYDKFVGFSQDLSKVGDSIKKADDNYQAAMNKLKTGAGNIISKVEGIRKLGAKASKKLPAEWCEEEVESESQKELF